MQTFDEFFVVLFFFFYLCMLNSANEENVEIEGVGVDGLHSSGKLDELGISKGPIFWVDSADSQPCVGTVGNMQWMMKATGKLFHSGLPHMVSLVHYCSSSISLD